VTRSTFSGHVYRAAATPVVFLLIVRHDRVAREIDDDAAA